MIEQQMAFFDMGLVFSAALGLGLWELISVRGALRQATPVAAPAQPDLPAAAQ